MQPDAESHDTLNTFVVRLANGKEVRVTGPSHFDVRDGALLMLSASGHPSSALAHGQWLSVNFSAAHQQNEPEFDSET